MYCYMIANPSLNKYRGRRVTHIYDECHVCARVCALIGNVDMRFCLCAVHHVTLVCARCIRNICMMMCVYV